MPASGQPDSFRRRCRLPRRDRRRGRSGPESPGPTGRRLVHLLAGVAVALAILLPGAGGGAASPDRTDGTSATDTDGTSATDTDGTSAPAPTADPDTGDTPVDEAAARLTVVDAVILGVVEGITEYLPVSSTGHLTVTQRLLGLGEGADEEAANTYAIAIQAGAIVAVVVLFHRRIAQLISGLLGRDPEGRHLLTNLILAFLPAAVIGVALEGAIKDRLFGPWPIVVAWIVGGAFILWWDRTQHQRPRTLALDQLTHRAALLIGVAQAIALWPGVSRSLVTIVAGLIAGLGLAAAVEFSFLLGLATLGAATIYDLVGNGGTLVEAYGIATPLIGLVVAFVSAVVAVRWMVTYLQRHPLSVFGWYRIGIGGVTIALLLGGLI